MLDALLRSRLKEQEARHLKRQRVVIADRQAMQLRLAEQDIINFCSSDYLDLATHPNVVDALKKGADRYGFGSGSAQLIAGHYGIHRELEQAFAAFLQRDDALLFNSGYTANLGVITTLADKSSAVFSDKANHASIVDAIQLSTAKHYRYAHNDLKHLSQRLGNAKEAHRFIVTESVFSMQGDQANLSAICDLANEHKAHVIVDDAHGAGVLGATGRGALEAAHLDQQQVPVLVTPLGKAFAGMGAIVSGSQTLIDSLLQFSRTYIYTTAYPPACAVALLASLALVQTETWRREALTHNIQYFKQAAEHRGLLLSPSETAIQVIRIDDNQRVMQLQRDLWDAGFYVAAIRPPTVPLGETCLRISLNCVHTQEQIMALVDNVARLYAQ